MGSARKKKQYENLGVQTDLYFDREKEGEPRVLDNAHDNEEEVNERTKFT